MTSTCWMGISMMIRRLLIVVGRAKVGYPYGVTRKDGGCDVATAICCRLGLPHTHSALGACKQHVRHGCICRLSNTAK